MLHRSLIRPQSSRHNFNLKRPFRVQDLRLPLPSTLWTMISCLISTYPNCLITLESFATVEPFRLEVPCSNVQRSSNFSVISLILRPCIYNLSHRDQETRLWIGDFCYESFLIKRKVIDRFFDTIDLNKKKTKNMK